MQTVELFVELARMAYDGVIYFDTFPDHGGLDPVAEGAANVMMADRLRAVAARLVNDDRLTRCHRPPGCRRLAAHRGRCALRPGRKLTAMTAPQPSAQ